MNFDRSRRDFLFKAGCFVAGAMSSGVLLTSCTAKKPDQLEVIVGKDIQAVSRDPADYQETDWMMLPGGNLESLNSVTDKYYLKVTSTGGIKPTQILTTIITSGDLALLMISAYENEPSSNKVSYHLDTGVYTHYLNREKRAVSGADGRMRIYFHLSDAPGFDYQAELPTFDEMRKNAFRLSLQPCQQFVLKGYYKSVDLKFYAPGRVPALASVKGNEKTLYTMHRRL